MLKPPNQSLPFTSGAQYFGCISHISHSCYMSRLPYPPGLYAAHFILLDLITLMML
jgi:hypothetical protein